MQTPAPLVVGIGRVVDALFLRIRGTEGSVHSQPVLDGEDCQHAVRLQVVPEDVAALGRSLVVAVPHTYAGHVVRRRGAHAELRPLVTLVHAGHFEREYLLAVHHVHHAVGNHAQVFAAGEHTGSGQQVREFAQGVVLPERVVTVVEEVGVEGVETLFLPGLEGAGIRGDERVEPAGLAWILDEEADDGQTHRHYLVAAVRQCRVEVAQQAALELQRDLPDTEEAEDMVDAEGVEVLAHLAQAALPPVVVVLCHLVPVVGGEAPVLTVHAEEIGRCAGAGIEVVELREAGSVHTVAAHSYGQVALQVNSLRMGVGHCVRKLEVQVPLYPAEVVFRQIVALAAVGGVGVEPGGVACREVLECLFSQVFLAVILEGLLHILVLEGHYPGIVHLGKGVQLFLQLRVGLDADGRQMHIDWMQSERGYRVIGVALGPVHLAGGIVDRQQLDYILPGAGGPVGEAFDVHEFTHAEVVVSAKRKHRNCSAGAAVARTVEDGCRVLAREGAALDGAVVPGIGDFHGGLAFRLNVAAVMVVPFGAGYEVALIEDVSVVFQQFLGAVANAYAPDVACSPGHGVHLVVRHKAEPFTPAGDVLY